MITWDELRMKFRGPAVVGHPHGIAKRKPKRRERRHVRSILRAEVVRRRMS